MFLSDAQKLFANSDLPKFWQMCKAIIEFPELADKCRGRLQWADNIANCLQKIEHRILWSAKQQEGYFIPHKQALDLVHEAYANNPNAN